MLLVRAPPRLAGYNEIGDRSRDKSRCTAGEKDGRSHLGKHPRHGFRFGVTHLLLLSPVVVEARTHRLDVGGEPEASTGDAAAQ